MYHFKIFLRHLSKNKLFTTISVFGFSVGLLFVILLSVYVDQELTVDNFHVNKDRIYRIETESDGASFPAPIADDLKNSIPEIEDFTRTLSDNANISAINTVKFPFEFLGVDAGFFNIFSFPLIKGDKEEVLNTKNSIVLSKKLALKLFNSVDIIGEEVYVNTDIQYQVTGVMEDFPVNTHFKKPDAIFNIRAFEDMQGFKNIMTEYGFGSLSIYLLAKPKTNLPAQAPEILKKFKKDFWIYKEGYQDGVEFTVLKDIYFSKKEGIFVKNNSKTLVVVTSVIVLLILILAIINYINLTIAQASFRFKEVVVKKLLGKSKRKLLISFILESIALCTIALIISLLLAKLAEPIFNQLLDTELNLNHKFTLKNIVLLFGFFSSIGIISGLIPALFMANFKPIEMVKGSYNRTNKETYAKGLVIFQYTITISLIICTAFIAKQTYFLRNHDLGFEKEQIAWFEYVVSGDKNQTIKNTLSKIPGVSQVSIIHGSPLDGGNNQAFDYEGRPMSFQQFDVDSTFFEMFKIKIHNKDVAYSKEGVYLNETAVRELGLTNDAVSFKMRGEELPILGIVNDFNFNSLKENIGPILIKQIPHDGYAWQMIVKLKSNNLTATMNKIRTTYSEIAEQNPYEYGFLADSISEWYIKEEKTAKIIGYFTVLSLLISALGILGMATFYTRQRKKEIGIRKVHGSRVIEDIIHLNKDFIRWVLTAFMLSIPIAYFSMAHWLENFAYKTSLSWWVFAIAGFTIFCVPFITVSWQSWKIAIRNPIEALRTE